MSVDIGRDSVLCLCAIAWADGTVDPSEAAGIRTAAQQLGLPPEDVAAVETALSARMGLDQVETVRMSRLTRLFTYAAAVWIAEVDGTQKPEESSVLSLLGDRLGLSTVARDRATTVARQHGGTASGGVDLLKLKSRLSAGLSQIGDE